MSQPFHNSSHCSVCSNSSLHEVLLLEKLPLTSTFTQHTTPKNFQGHDLLLLLCDNCNHLQSSSSLNPKDFYTPDDYPFRSSQSSISVTLNNALHQFLINTLPNRTFDHALEVGCSDCYFLKQIEPICNSRTGLDPVLKNKHGQITDDGINLCGISIEDLKPEDLHAKPDLVIFSHTLEHVEAPFETLQKIINLAADDAICLIEIPNFEALYNRSRFDQVFHHHLQYFNKKSLPYLIERLDCDLIAAYENDLHWGSFTVCFQKKKANSNTHKVKDTQSFSKENISKRFNAFQEKSKKIGQEISTLSDNLYGFGASQLLPVFAYHWDTDLADLKYIIDDDPNKQSLSYKNLNVSIQKQEDDFPFNESTILITAVDSAAPILNVLKSKDTHRVINPLTFM